MKTSLLTLALICAAAFSICNAQTPVYLDDSATLDARVENALSRMTLREKIALIHAQSKFSAPGVPRLGIPEVWTSNGPHGVRPEVKWDEWEQAGWTNDSITFSIDITNAGTHSWVAEPGKFTAHVAAASDDIRSSVQFVLK